MINDYINAKRRFLDAFIGIIQIAVLRIKG